MAKLEFPKHTIPWTARPTVAHLAAITARRQPGQPSQGLRADAGLPADIGSSKLYIQERRSRRPCWRPLVGLDLEPGNDLLTLRGSSSPTVFSKHEWRCDFPQVVILVPSLHFTHLIFSALDEGYALTQNDRALRGTVTGMPSKANAKYT